jgi:hypothetical protein
MKGPGETPELHSAVGSVVVWEAGKHLASRFPLCRDTYRISFLALMGQMDYRREFREALRFPRPCLLGRRFSLLPDQIGVSQSLANDLGKDGFESGEVANLLAVLVKPGVEAERLLVNVAEQVEGLDTDVCRLRSDQGNEMTYQRVGAYVDPKELVG